MTQEWRDGVFRIDSAAKDQREFGTGFVCHREGNKTYLLTCLHVVEAIGEAQARIRQQPIQVIARGDDTLDLALIAVAGLSDSPVLPLSDAGEQGNPFVVFGYTWADPNDKKSGKSLARPLEGQLGADTAFASDQWPKVPAWDLPFDENNQFAQLLDGYSGSPVWDPHNQSVMAVVSHRRGKKMGYAIAVSNLLKLYPQAVAFFLPNASVSLNAGINMIEQNDSLLPTRIFVSYSHKDTTQKDEVVACLGALPPDTKINEWVDTRMLAGDNIDETIFREIEQTDLFLALISRYYLNSNYCREEMKTALRQAEQRGCRVVPIIVRKTASWRDWPIGRHLALPPDGKAPSDWNDPDDHWHAVEAGLKALIQELSRLQNQWKSEPQTKSHHTHDNAQNPNQTPLEPPSGSEFFESVRKALIDLFSHNRLAGAAQVLVETQAEVEPTQAVDMLLQLEPLEAINRWNEIVTELYDKTSVMGEAQKEVWSLLESVHLYLLPRLVDLSRLVKDMRFPQDALLFTIAAPHESPNRPIELLFARMNRKRVVQFEQRGRQLARDFAVPCNALDVSDPAFCARADPDFESAVEQLGFELMKRFSLNPPEQMRAMDWKKLDARLKAGRHGKLGFYLIIPHANHYADPAVLTRLYRYLPNLPKFLMADAVGNDLPFVCDPFDIDAAIEVFWDLKISWCGDEANP